MVEHNKCQSIHTTRTQNMYVTMFAVLHHSLLLARLAAMVVFKGVYEIKPTKMVTKFILSQIYSNYYNFVLTKITKTLPPERFLALKYPPKCGCGRGSVLPQTA